MINLPDHVANPNPGIYKSDNFIVIDFETTNLDYGSALNPDNKIVLTCFRCGTDPYIWHHTGNEYEIQHIVELCHKADFIVAHNAKFELQWLVRAGLDLTKVVVFDTMIAEYVLLGNRKQPLNLNACCERHGFGQKDNYISNLLKNGVCPSTMPDELLLKYCKKDVKLTYGLFHTQLELLWLQGLLPVFYSRCLFTPCLADMERNGMCLDKDLVTQEFSEYVTKYQDIIHTLDDMTGGINPRSTKQVSEFLYDTLKFPELKDRRGKPVRTPKGGRKADTGTIAALKPKNKRQREFLALKKTQGELNAALTKTLKPFNDCVNENDLNILYANFNQTVTGTHRLSSSGSKYKCQFQNFPRKFKKLFTVRNEGWTISEIDSAQLEFRIAVFLAQDVQGFEDIHNKVDVHQFTADIIGCTRPEAKPHTFKPLYGGKSGTPKEMEYYQAFTDKYPDITAMQDGWKMDVLRDSYLTTLTGLKFYWNDTEITRSGYITNSTAICNYPVQMFATADIMQISVLLMWHLMKSAALESFLINTIHDSAIGEVHPGEQEEYQEIGEYAFSEGVKDYIKKMYEIDINVPLESEISFNTHWG